MPVLNPSQQRTAVKHSRRIRSTRKQITFSCTALLLFLLILECAARLFSAPPAQGRFRQISEIVSFLSTEDSSQILESDPDTFWKLRPGVTIHKPKSIIFQGVVSNSLGYRNIDFQLQRPASTFRIVCFGDSSTFGIGTPHDQTWPAQLESSLRQIPDQAQIQFQAASVPHAIEVVNAGVPGYTSHQILQKMRCELQHLAPDIVFVTCANNDFWRWDDRTDIQQAKRLADTSLRRFILRSRAIQIADTLYSQLVDSHPQHDAEWARQASHNYFRPEATWTPRVPLADFKRNLNAMADLCGKHGIPLVPVIWPDQPQAAGQWSIRIAYHDVMFQVARERGLPVVDITTAFRQRPWSVQCYIPNDIVHVNAEGNRIAAAAAKDVLAELLPTITGNQPETLPVGFTTGVSRN